MASRPSTEAYREIGKAAARFAKMVTDFGRTSSSEFLKLYPDYDYDGTDYVCHQAEALADLLDSYVGANLSGMARERAKQAAKQVA